MNRWPLAAFAIALALVAPAQALAADPLGTAGRFMMFAWANCGAPILEQFQGACDPPAVAEGLPGPARATAHIKRAIALISFGRLDQASEAADAALKADPRNVEALVFRARLSMSQMAHDAANRDLNAGLLAAPDNPLLLATRAEFSVENGDPKAALRDASLAIKQQLDNADIHRIKARAHIELNQLGDAKTHLNRALELEPGARQATYWRAQAHMRSGEFEQAISDASALLAKRPNDPPALELRAVSHTALGRIEEAVADLTRLLGEPGEIHTGKATVPHFSQLLVQRAILLVKLKRKAEANRDLDAIVGLGGQRALLRLQVFLRRNGFKDLPLDGQRTADFDQALEACIINQACGRGLVRSL